jgi:WD40 repeat protein
MEITDEKCLYLSFNQDSSLFCIGTNKGFRVFTSNPFKCVGKRDISGGIGIVEILNNTNIFALVGTEENLKFGPNKVILWNELKQKVENQLIVSNNVKNIKIKRTKIFIIEENNILVFTLGNYEKIDSLKTFTNKIGIFGISLDPKINMISYPSPDAGKIITKDYDNKIEGDFIVSEINAHKNEIIALVMNYDGSLIASASERGTIIKIFKSKDGSLLQELRRGTEPAEIYSLAFDFKSRFIACSSNKGTVHIFNINNDEIDEKNKNQKSILGNVVKYLGFKNEYLSSEWSFAQYRLTCKEKNIISFNHEKDDIIIVITLNGKYYQGIFDTKKKGEIQTNLEGEIWNMEVENKK